MFFTVAALLLGPSIFKDRSDSAVWYFLHIVGGSVALTLGPFQFIAPLRNRFRRYHRVAGYTYVVASIMAVVGFIGLPKIELFLTSQLVALALWVLCMLFAVRAIRAGKVLSHQHNMARSFVLACYFLTARLLDQHGMWLLAPLASQEPVKLAHSDWVAWLVPLALVEIYFTLKWQATLRGKNTEGATH
ncbi:DUF2306 domain-containing protein [Lysobacter arenosi]|uniref:DUF2306 domain-containing protein n=1 Tax=Lysobacter arenosi TaxID=2795387 RepID=A0ABX7R6V7_9GAMM|nr:DUF2306 domain-containing protein [Lysobacter arenosi]QSX73848.1 DUF2306 domain-containing protein [Lysobacter arenosi]